jgi:hypothetical protein
METFARLIAIYLPQFHPIAENDLWWGAGFTEWTNTAKAVPLFRGHRQPNIPSDLGFYDLRLPEVRNAQAQLAKDHSIEAFCYYHYWFGGRRILERPFNEVLESGQPDFPFCLFWANQSWTGIWHGAPNRLLIEQTYSGEADHIAHFNWLLKAFQDPRYVTVDGKPLFLIYKPNEIPHIRAVIQLWRSLAERSGLKGLYLVAQFPGVSDPAAPSEKGFDAGFQVDLPQLRPWISRRQPARWLRFQWQRVTGKPTIYAFRDVHLDIIGRDPLPEAWYPCLLPNWDNTPRSGSNGLVLHGSSPQLFRDQVRKALSMVGHRDREKRIVFVKSWNEWAEGNYLEPDHRFGRGYLDVLREENVCIDSSPQNGDSSESRG